MKVVPDWYRSGKVESLEAHIGNGFKITGPGLYLSDSDTVLVATTVTDGGKLTYWVYVWNNTLDETILCQSELFRKVVFKVQNDVRTIGSP